MVLRTYAQRTLIEVLLPEADKLWDPVLRQMDLVLEDEDPLDQITGALARRHPLSARRGRLGTPAADGCVAETRLAAARGSWTSRP